MKKQFRLAGIFLLIIAAVVFIAFKPPQNDKEKKNQPNNQGRNNDKGNQGKKDDNANKGKPSTDPGQGNNKGNQGNDKVNNDNKGNNENNGNNDNRGNNDNKGNSNRNYTDYDYRWTRETFKDRRKMKNSEKVTVCHKFSRGDHQAVTIRVSSNALKAHMGHGDIMGGCPAYADKRYSNKYWDVRNEYYDTYYQHEDQVYYSRSVYDYALQRLAESRLQLNTYQINNMPPAQIEQRRLVVVELEQNVSLLDRLLTAAASYAVDRLL
jgi:hypothetical protein